MREQLPYSPDKIRKTLDEYLPTSSWQKSAQRWIDSAPKQPYDNSTGGGFWSGVGRTLGNAGAWVNNTETEIGQGVASVANRLVFGVADLAKLLGSYGASPTAQTATMLDAMIFAEMGRLGLICVECIAAMAKEMGHELIKPVTDAWAKGEYVRAITEGGLELAMLIGPIIAKVGEVAKAAEIAKAAEATKAAEAAKAAEQGAVVARPPLLDRYLSETGGRWGGKETRLQNHEIATSYENSGARVTGGAGRASEEWIPGPGGGTKGGTFVDVTIQDGGNTIRIQTVTTMADGVTPTASEAAAAARIRAAFPKDTLIIVPKTSK